MALGGDIQSIYQDFLGRPPRPDELQYWTYQVQNNKKTLGQVQREFLDVYKTSLNDSGKIAASIVSTFPTPPKVQPFNRRLNEFLPAAQEQYAPEYARQKNRALEQYQTTEQRANQDTQFSNQGIQTGERRTLDDLFKQLGIDQGTTNQNFASNNLFNSGFRQSVLGDIQNTYDTNYNRTVQDAITGIGRNNTLLGRTLGDVNTQRSQFLNDLARQRQADVQALANKMLNEQYQAYLNNQKQNNQTFTF